ncbi:hypothetical protein [Flavobacterium sp.]|uniref:hypothetical protein n=1 Tax=Flavobacterium sp. TaxID=239 RepID=UPI002B4B0AB5|nr:hypothetical protein [Flavobacterium sp.]HLF52786.1 hypothetical protein [Flavobacterium sp.]
MEENKENKGVTTEVDNANWRTFIISNNMEYAPPRVCYFGRSPETIYNQFIRSYFAKRKLQTIRQEYCSYDTGKPPQTTQ